MARGDDGWRDAFLESREWRTVRMRVLEKHGAKCQCCGRTAQDGITINVDHIKPRSKYPELALTEDNLQILCNECNHGKGSWSERDWRPSRDRVVEGLTVEDCLSIFAFAILQRPQLALSPVARRFADVQWAHENDRCLRDVIDVVCLLHEVNGVPFGDEFMGHLIDGVKGDLKEFVLSRLKFLDEHGRLDDDACEQTLLELTPRIEAICNGA